ncbi:bacterio-opsin activator domain-containing protein [Haladaptatus halobius]|uniref:bacterio-opsin activator domain-containing protein n=1 Tax=Haladaptatus halobius TaxID=2884875 RepID=UPI001D09E995|nr:bacterio-opsin activator domain-containing protein [Haladaptatus halobius]
MAGTVAEVEVPADEFALKQMLSTTDGIEFEVERVVAHDDGRVMPFVWVSGSESELEEIEALLADDPSVEQVELLAELPDEWLYQMEWVSEIEMLVQVLVEEEGTVLAAMGNKEKWNLRTLFPNRNSLSRTYKYCDEHGLSMEIINIYQLEDGRQGRFGLTDDQQTALTLAYDHGYYSIPREATTEDLAEELNVTHQAVSERLRRGHENMIENGLILGGGADDQDKK